MVIKKHQTYEKKKYLLLKNVFNIKYDRLTLNKSDLNKFLHNKNLFKYFKLMSYFIQLTENEEIESKINTNILYEAITYIKLQISLNSDINSILPFDDDSNVSIEDLNELTISKYIFILYKIEFIKFEKELSKLIKFNTVVENQIKLLYTHITLWFYKKGIIVFNPNKKILWHKSSLNKKYSNSYINIYESINKNINGNASTKVIFDTFISELDKLVCYQYNLNSSKQLFRTNFNKYFNFIKLPDIENVNLNAIKKKQTDVIKIKTIFNIKQLPYSLIKSNILCFILDSNDYDNITSFIGNFNLNKHINISNYSYNIIKMLYYTVNDEIFIKFKNQLDNYKSVIANQKWIYNYIKYRNNMIETIN